jgi:hypothetical protein
VLLESVSWDVGEFDRLVDVTDFVGDEELVELRLEGGVGEVGVDLAGLGEVKLRISGWRLRVEDPRKGLSSSCGGLSSVVRNIPVEVI